MQITEGSDEIGAKMQNLNNYLYKYFNAQTWIAWLKWDNFENWQKEKNLGEGESREPHNRG